ncbi:hypothetical protein D915_001624 [Fasciola hepatica]|uniref:Leucine Rich repeat-containing domain protein n=1 Tax=Fasciola hepatica TaxID=6192 RepID=A0A4E0RPN6_FASHE|nr:hypothetical protein D915_001624 [Fasciola hepatica]
MGLDTVPNQLTNCSRLQVLNLYGNQITTLPEELSKLQRLEQLYLDARHFIEIVTTHQRASRPFGPALQTRTSNAFVQSLPKTLQSALTSPEPESQGTAEDVNKVNRSIIEKIKSLLKKGKMKSLHLPNVVFRLKSIRFLRLEHSSLNVLPENLGVMKFLESLSLAGNYFRQIPTAIYGVRRTLKYLDLSDNILSDGYNSLPSGFGTELPNLTHLRMRHTRLRQLEATSLVGLKSLEVLDLSDNKITSIPDELHELPELYSLDVSKNQLTELPASLCQLKHLMDLNCSRNLINALPSRLYRLKQIEQAHVMDGLDRRGLWIVGNPLQSIPKAIWQSTSTKRLWNFLRNTVSPGNSGLFQHEKRKQIPEQQIIKCILLGDCSSGRSQLLEQMVKYGHPDGKQVNIWQKLTEVSYPPYLSNRPVHLGDSSLISSPVLISRCQSPNGVPFVFYNMQQNPVPSDGEEQISLFPLIHRHVFDAEALYIVVFDLSRVISDGASVELLKAEFKTNIGRHLTQVQMYVPGAIVKLVGLLSSAHVIHDHELVDKYLNTDCAVNKELVAQPLSDSEGEVGSDPTSVRFSERSSRTKFLLHLATEYLQEHLNRIKPDSLKPIQILSEVTILALGAESVTQEDESCIRIQNPEELWDDLEKRIYSPLFAHRRYRAPESWNNLAKMLCRDHSEKLLVQVKLNHSEISDDSEPHFDQADVLTSKHFSAYGVTEVESCLRHCHTSGHLVWIREHHVLKNVLILQPTYFFRTLTGILCPSMAICPPICKPGQNVTEYLHYLTGMNQTQTNKCIQLLQAHGALCFENLEVSEKRTPDDISGSCAVDFLSCMLNRGFKWPPTQCMKRLLYHNLSVSVLSTRNN